MDESQRRKIGDEMISTVFSGAREPEHFKLLSLGGQPGAGKTAALMRLVHHLGGGSVVPVLGDDLRAFHPRFDELRFDPDPEVMPRETAPLSGWLVEQALSYACREGYSVAVEGTWRRPEVTVGTLAQFAAVGAATHAVVLAVPAAVSWQGCVSRYVEAAAHCEAARWTPHEAHDESYRALGRTLELVERSPAVGRVSVMTRSGEFVYDNERTADGWKQPPAALQALGAHQQTSIDMPLFDNIQKRLERLAREHNLGPVVVEGLARARLLAQGFTPHLLPGPKAGATSPVSSLGHRPAMEGLAPPAGSRGTAIGL